MIHVTQSYMYGNTFCTRNSHARSFAFQVLLQRIPFELWRNLSVYLDNNVFLLFTQTNPSNFILTTTVDYR
jgi:hypothetical protein